MKFNQLALATALTSTLLLAPLAAQAQSKKELVQKLLSIQQTALEGTARGLAEQPARQLAGAAQPVIMQAVPEDKREAVAKQVDGEIKKYLDAATPILRASTLKLSQTVVGPMFEEKFTEDELKQLLGMLDSPVLKKYQGLLPEMSAALLDKVVQDARPQVDPKLQAAQSSIRAILEAATAANRAGGASKPAAGAGKSAPKK